MPKQRTIFRWCETCGALIEQVNRRRRFCSIACFTTPIDARLWARVVKADEPDGCWDWTGYRDPNGYGRIYARNTGRSQCKPVLTHRLAWEMTHGAIAEGLSVLHACDNPGCVRPSHLFLGTRADNAKDAKRKGRHTHGARVPGAKLTDAGVIFARRRYAEGGITQKALAAMLGVAQGTMADILNGRRWKHLLPDH
jgi:hypothetical protein